MVAPRIERVEPSGDPGAGAVEQRAVGTGESTLSNGSVASGFVPVVVLVASATSTAADVCVVCRMYGTEPSSVVPSRTKSRMSSVLRTAWYSRLGSIDWNAPTLSRSRPAAAS